MTAVFTPSKYQTAVFDWIKTGSGNAIINAVAGSGKSTTLVEAAKLIGDKTGLFLAFNKHIADELKTRLVGTSMVASTIHSLSKMTLEQHLGKRTDPNKGFAKWRDLVKEQATILAVEKDKQYQWSRALEKLVEKVMVTLTDAKDEAALWRLVDHFGMEDVTPNMLKRIPILLDKAEAITRATGQINFNEMIYWACVWGLEPTKYDWVFVDECLPALTPIQLADGTSMPIGEIVDHKRSVEVLAYDAATQTQKACKVVGWSKTLNQKPLVKIKVHWLARKGNNRPTNFVVCTVNHKVWANEQWMYAGDVKPGMKMQVETSAIKSQAYKITSAGRKTLSAEMALKNEAGLPPGMKGKITKRGGNGKGVTVPQWTLWQALGEGWLPEYIVPTKMARNSGYPTNYKIDIANPDRMIAIEVDGSSHQVKNRQVQDQKKQALLESKGWRVIHISNRDAIQHTNDCISRINNSCEGGDCPIDAVVVSVEPIELPDMFVYDITVEDCHNFYANGILVHNCQDLNAMQLEMALRAKANTGRIVCVGDERQAIYGFAGADAASFNTIRTRANAQELPLSVNYRCPKSHLALVRDIVPHIEDGPNAIEGVVHFKAEDEIYTLAQPRDYVVCRLNAPLVSTCIKFIQRRKSARVIGRDIGKDLCSLLDKVAERETFDYSEIVKHLDEYERQQVIMLSQKEGNEQKIESLQDRIECLQVCAAEFNDCHDIGCLKVEIEKLFGDEGDDVFSGVSLSTVHKAKGLEANRIFVLKPDKLPLKWKNQSGWQYTQELNIRYIALTRAKQELFILGTLPPLGPAPAPKVEVIEEDESNPLLLEVISSNGNPILVPIPNVVPEAAAALSTPEKQALNALRSAKLEEDGFDDVPPIRVFAPPIIEPEPVISNPELNPKYTVGEVVQVIAPGEEGEGVIVKVGTEGKGQYAVKFDEGGKDQVIAYHETELISAAVKIEPALHPEPAAFKASGNLNVDIKQVGAPRAKLLALVEQLTLPEINLMIDLLNEVKQAKVEA